MMGLCTDTITVFNASLDADTGYDVYTGTVIKNVSWYRKTEATVTQNGLKAADSVIIRIPEDADFSGKSYADPVTYKSGDTDTLFTFQRGDIVVKGEVDATDPRPADLQKQYGEIITILSITDNRRAPNAPHWRITGA